MQSIQIFVNKKDFIIYVGAIFPAYIFLKKYTCQSKDKISLRFFDKGVKSIFPKIVGEDIIPPYILKVLIIAFLRNGRLITAPTETIKFLFLTLLSFFIVYKWQ